MEERTFKSKQPQVPTPPYSFLSVLTSCSHSCLEAISILFVHIQLHITLMYVKTRIALGLTLEVGSFLMYVGV